MLNVHCSGTEHIHTLRYFAVGLFGREVQCAKWNLRLVVKTFLNLNLEGNQLFFEVNLGLKKLNQVFRVTFITSLA